MRSIARLPAALSLAIGLISFPATTAVACSCSGLGGPVEIAAASAANSTVAFVGTVVDVQGGERDAAFGLPLMRYAFAVNRATIPVPERIEVRAVDDGGGASCGFTFGLDETWFVAADEQDGALHTNLCSGNMLMEQLAAGDREGVASLMTVEPTPGSAASVNEMDWMPLALLGLAILAVGGVTVVAFRRDRVS